MKSVTIYRLCLPSDVWAAFEYARQQGVPVIISHEWGLQFGGGWSMDFK